MKKAILLLFTAALCAVLLCGCRMSVRPSVGLASFCYEIDTTSGDVRIEAGW